MSMNGENALHIERINLGAVSAYAVAKKNGFTGTEAEWEQYIANASLNAQAAAQSAQDAADSAADSAESAEEASHYVDVLRDQTEGLFVRYDEDAALTEADKAQFRKNIGVSETSEEALAALSESGVAAQFSPEGSITKFATELGHWTVNGEFDPDSGRHTPLIPVKGFSGFTGATVMPSTGYAAVYFDEDFRLLTEWCIQGTGNMVFGTVSEAAAIPASAVYMCLCGTGTAFDTNITLQEPAGTVLRRLDALEANSGVKAMLAPAEATNTASMAHAVGDYFILGDTLYVATAAIAVGAEIVTSGSEANCRAAVLGNEVGAVKDAVDSLAVENVSPVTGWVQGNIIESNGQSQGTGSVTYEKTVRTYTKLVSPDYVSVAHPDSIKIRLFVFAGSSLDTYIGARDPNDGDLSKLAGKYVRITAAYTAGGNIVPDDVDGLINIVSSSYTDKTLSAEGKAADAKAAGDAITQIRTDIAQIETDVETDIARVENDVETGIARIESEMIGAVGSKANAPTANASGSIISITGMAENSTLGKLDLSLPYDANGYSAFDITCTGKNLFGGRTMMNKIYDVSSPKATKNETAGTIKFAGSSVSNKKFFTAFKPNVQYTFIFDVEESGSNGYVNMKLWYTDGTNDFITIEKTTSRQTVRVVSNSGKSVESLRGASISGSTTLYVDTCGVFEGVVSAEEFAEYSGQTFSFTPDAALYGGDFDALTGALTSRYDASGEELDPPTTESLTPISYLFRQDSGCVWASAGTLDIEYRQSVDGYVADYVDTAIAALNQPPIVVAPSGGDYSSFTQAVYEHRSDSYAEFVIKPGTYDIVAEYVALFGQETVDTLADATDLSGFQYGIRVNNKKITFESGSHLVCDWTGHTVNSTHRFCAFSVGRNSELIGMDLDCTATFYAIHDDYGLTDRYYENIYRNCRVIGHGITNQNLIGGGCKPYSKHVIDNCYFDNGTSEGACVRYHNTNLAKAEPVIWVSNSYFAQALTFRYYGSQTTKMRAYVNNCRASYINKGAEGSATVDNVELYAWNNETGS